MKVSLRKSDMLHWAGHIIALAAVLIAYFQGRNANDLQFEQLLMQQAGFFVPGKAVSVQPEIPGQRVAVTKRAVSDFLDSTEHIANVAMKTRVRFYLVNHTHVSEQILLQVWKESRRDKREIWDNLERYLDIKHLDPSDVGTYPEIVEPGDSVLFDMLINVNDVDADGKSGHQFFILSQSMPYGRYSYTYVWVDVVNSLMKPSGFTAEVDTTSGDIKVPLGIFGATLRHYETQILSAKETKRINRLFDEQQKLDTVKILQDLWSKARYRTND